MKILVTGSEGFLGRNLLSRLSTSTDHEILPYDITVDSSNLPNLLESADAIVHLAGVNRPKEPDEFSAGNYGFTSQIADRLEDMGRATPLIFASSIQAALENEYGKSKLAAEERLRLYASRAGARVRVFRFANVFGKWCRPNYNSVIATFCHNIAHGLSIVVQEKTSPLRLVHVDDAMIAVLRELESADKEGGFAFVEAEPVFETTVGIVADIILSIHKARTMGLLPDFADALTKKIYSTYLSYLEPEDLSLPVTMRTDDRGGLFELIKSPNAGQIFVSTTRPGKSRGNHFHHSKVEKFCVVLGNARISLRRIDSSERIDFHLSGENIRIIDIPPGFSHSIENTGRNDCVTIFWSNEIFDASHPDTYIREV